MPTNSIKITVGNNKRVYCSNFEWTDNFEKDIKVMKKLDGSV